MNRQTLAYRRAFSVTLLAFVLALMACNIPGCAPQPGPTPPGGTAIPPTVDPASLPPTNPRIVAQRPYPGEELPLDGSVDIYFDQPMDRVSVERALRIEPAVQADVTWIDDSTVRVTPRSGELKRAARYRVSVGEGAESRRGLQMEQTFVVDVQTVGFLQVGEAVPAPDAAGVAADAVITVFFNRPVVPLGIAGDASGLPQPLTFSPDIPGAGEWINTSIYQWTPSAPLAGSQTYTVTVQGDLADQTGGIMEAPYSWSFTTLPPDVTTVLPASSASDVGLDQPVQVTFNQPMDRASTERAFLLERTDRQAVEAVPGRFSWDESGQIMTFNPAGGLQLDAIYQASLSASARAATGAATLSRDFTWTFQAVRTPAVLSTEPFGGQQGVPSYYGVRFLFTAPMDPDSFTEDMVVTDPPLPDTASFYYSDYDRSWNVSAEWLPSTTYTVTLQPGASDPYGNRISDPYTFSFTTGPLDPWVQINAQGLVGYYDSAVETELFVLYRNVSRLDFQLARLPLGDFARLTGPDAYSYFDSYTPAAGDTLREWSIPSEGALNEAVYARVPLTTPEGRSLEPGTYLLTLDAPEVQYGRIRHLIVVTNANLTLKSSFDESLVWLTDLRTGQPLSGIPVTLYNERFGAVADGVTGRDGVLELEAPHRANLWSIQYAVAEGGGVFAVATTDLGEGIYPWDFGLPGFFDFQDFSLYLYTDRPLYRPGQEVFFKGILRSKNDVVYALPPDQQITVRVFNDQGDEIRTVNLPLSEFGTFSGSLTLDQEASLGYYSIMAEYHEIQTGLGFQVAEYRKPEFVVSVTPEEPAVVEGDTIRVAVDTRFFFGGPVSGAGVTWTVLADAYFFDYQGPGAYSFNDFPEDEALSPDFIPGYGEVIAEGSGVTDDQGRLLIQLPASLDDSATSRRLTIEATVTDINQTSVSNRAEVIIHRGRYYVGVSPDVYVGVAGQPQSARLLVVDWESAPVPDQDVSVQIVERRWNSVQERDQYGRTQWTWTVEDIPVGDPQTVTTDDLGRASVTFTPPRGGIFRIVATVADPQGNRQRGAAYIWVSGTEFVAWRQANNDRIDLIADRRDYAPGDTAEILIPSPFQGEDVQALVTVERGSILQHEVITLPTNSTVYRLPITGDFAPNAYVSVVIVGGVTDSNPVPSYRMGLVEIRVDPVEQSIRLEVTPDRDKVGPREEVTYTITAADHEGNPVDAEVSLALVDLATLSLAPPNSGSIVEHFYGLQGLGVRTAVPLGYLVNRRNQELFDRGKGGGGGGGEGFFEVRGDFRDTAYWSARVRTGEDGAAEVTITLPDNLTTWRMDARAVTGDTLVGQAQVDIVSTRPLLVRPQTPRFFVAGDQSALSAVVNNNTPDDLEVTVTLQASGAQIVGRSAQQVRVPAGGRADVSWSIEVDAEARWVDLTFTAGGGGLSDASKPPLGDPANGQMLPVYRYEVPETVGTAGQLVGEAARIEGVVLPPTYDVTQGNVRVQIDPSLAASTLEGLDYLEHYPYECTEQTVSRFLPNAMTLLAFRQFDLQDAALEAALERNLNVGLQRLYAQQHIDGGWGWWVNSPSNPTVTAYVVQGLVAASETGAAVEDRVLNDAVRYLQGQLRPLDTLDDHSLLNRQAYMLYVLARAGQPDASRTVQLFENRQSLAIWARALLAQTLWMIDPADPRLQDIQSDLVSSALVSATGAHWEEPERDRANWATDTRTTAIVLDTFALLWPDSDLAPNITRWLMIARQGGHWETTQETVWALIGLSHWMVATGELEPDFTWEFTFNGAPLASGQAVPASVTESEVITIDVRDLMRDEVNRLLFERTEGPGRLYYTAHLTAYLPVEEVEPLNRGIVVTRRYLDSQGRPVTQGRVGDVLTVELTLIAPADLYYLVVEDPYPAGAEAVDAGLLTESVVGERPQVEPSDPLAQGWGWWLFTETELRDEKAVLFADFLPAGTYQHRYQVRLGLPGAYRVIPPVAREFYFPEVYGRGEGMLFTILP